MVVFLGIFNLIKDIKKYNFDKIIIFNSSLRFNLISRFSGIPEVYQYPLFKNQDSILPMLHEKFYKR